MSISFPMLGKFLDIMPSNRFSTPFFLFGGTLRMLVHLMLSHRSLDVSSFLKSFFFLFWFKLSDCHYSVFQLAYPLHCIMKSTVLYFFFISVIVFFSSAYFFFLFCMPLLNILPCPPILHPSSSSIFVVIALNSLLGRRLVSTLLSPSKILPCCFILNLFVSCLVLPVLCFCLCKLGRSVACPDLGNVTLFM